MPGRNASRAALDVNPVRIQTFALRWSSFLQFAREAWWAARRIVLQQTFDIWQVLGLHVTPNHFYDPIPDTRNLPQSLWTRLDEMVGIDMRADQQLRLLDQFQSRFRGEYDAFPAQGSPSHGSYFVNNGTFESVDGEVLFCMVRHFRPERIVEIGAGASTLAAAEAVVRNTSEGYPCRLTSIDPFPPTAIRAGVSGLTELAEKPAQEMPLEVFTQLQANDILFIDSSHVVRIGGDVVFELLQVVPRLQVGVLVHVHDIFLPAEYAREWVLNQKRFWTEQYLLQAFLAFNSEFEVVWGASYMHLNYPDKLAAAFSSYRSDRCWPGSFWFRRVLSGSPHHERTPHQRMQ